MKTRTRTTRLGYTSIPIILHTSINNCEYHSAKQPIPSTLRRDRLELCALFFLVHYFEGAWANGSRTLHCSPNRYVDECCCNYHTCDFTTGMATTIGMIMDLFLCSHYTHAGSIHSQAEQVRIKRQVLRHMNHKTGHCAPHLLKPSQLQGEVKHQTNCIHI